MFEWLLCCKPAFTVRTLFAQLNRHGLNIRYNIGWTIHPLSIKWSWVEGGSWLWQNFDDNFHLHDVTLKTIDEYIWGENGKIPKRNT